MEIEEKELKKDQESFDRKSFDKMNSCAAKGVDLPFIQQLRDVIRSLILTRAEAIYFAGRNHEQLPRQNLKSVEKILHFYDYQACAISLLARLAATGNSRSREIVEVILSKVEWYLDSGQDVLSASTPPRRFLLHLVRAYHFLNAQLSSAEQSRWKFLVRRITDSVLKDAADFYPGVKDVHTRRLGTGTNHRALAAEGVYAAGMMLDEPLWCEMAADFCDRLIDFCHPDGYFEEHTNDEREGGPSLDYTNLSLGAVYHISRMRGVIDRHVDFFNKCAKFSRCFSNTGLNYAVFADERTNRDIPRMFGLAAHSLSPEGRGYIRLRMGLGMPQALEDMEPDMLARLDYELDGMQCGTGVLPEPWQSGDFSLTLPLAVRRRSGWTCGVSALRSLNRELYPNGTSYALDRQNLIYLSHERCGVILPGIKSLGNPLFSSLCVGEDAYPVAGGTVQFTETELLASPVYRGFKADISWRIFSPDEICLTVTSPREGSICLQLPLELGLGEKISIDGKRQLELGDTVIFEECVHCISCSRWSLSSEEPGSIQWPVSVHDPYNEACRCLPGENRLLWKGQWERCSRIVFKLHPDS